MIVEFPKGIKIDLNNIPDDFEERIKTAFADYTSGTVAEYTYCDKLVFIDWIAEGLHFIEDYRKRLEDGRLHYQFPDDDKCFEKTLKLVYRAIKAVIEWEN